jgi:uncharacterized alpha-E superfamily protein
MLSRVAEAIFWMSRYIERAENVARFIDVNLNLMLETPIHHRSGWESLVMTTGDQAWFEKHYETANSNNVGWFLTFDEEYPNSILSSLTAARQNARTVREVISREMWQELNEFYLMVKEASQSPFSLEEMSSFYSRVKMMGIHYAGATDATLSRGDAWSFARMGRHLERADKTSRILDVKYYLLLTDLKEVGTTFDQLGWNALLNSASALQMYRQLHHLTTPQNVAKFLLFNRFFPRAILYCVTEAQKSLHGISGTPPSGCANEAERLLGSLQAELNYTRIEDVMTVGLHEYIDKLQLALNDAGIAVTEEFFSPPMG